MRKERVGHHVTQRVLEAYTKLKQYAPQHELLIFVQNATDEGFDIPLERDTWNEFRRKFQRKSHDGLETMLIQYATILENELLQYETDKTRHQEIPHQFH